jgi:hypothetical protein
MSASRAKPQVESVGTLEGTVKDHVEWLLVVGPRVVEATVVVLTTDPGAPGLTTTSANVATPPAAREVLPFREQVTVLEELVKEQVGAGVSVGVAETKLAETYKVPAGRMSVTITPAAEAGPAFVTVRV